MGWKKCSEEMPPEEVAVLFWSPYATDYVRVGFVDEGSIVLYGTAIMEITHWQPLPPAPTEDE